MSWGRPTTMKEKVATKLLLPASLAFGVGSYVRLMAYSTGSLKQKSFAAEVISVGNITCGGTGKTPVTIDLARRLIRQGRKVAILSRGYKRMSQQPIVVASDGQGNYSLCTECGDEPFLMAKSVAEAVVLVGAKRVDTAKLAIEKYGCDTILLDDGFQHLAIARNQDVVLLDYNDDPALDHLLPAGRLREPAAALARADWIVITKVPANPDVERLKSLRVTIEKFAPTAQISSCRMVSDGLQALSEQAATMRLTDTKVLAFSAIARPESFITQLRELGADVRDSIAYGDHHWYTHEDVREIEAKYYNSQAQLIVTTEKDAVKLLPGLVRKLPMYALKQKLEWLGPVPAFYAEPVSTPPGR